MSDLIPDPAIAAACVRAWLRNPRPVRFRPRTGVVRYRQAAELRAAGLTYAQIASVMGCSVASVGNFLRHARKRGASK